MGSLDWRVRKKEAADSRPSGSSGSKKRRRVPFHQPTEALSYQGRLVCRTSGSVRAWNLQDGIYDEDFVTKFSHEGLTHIAADGHDLWATRDSTLYSWVADASSWRRVADFEGNGEELVALVAVGGAPLLIFASDEVRAPTLGHTFQVPIDSFRILALHASDSRLWIGTGLGEWGGHLIGLNLNTGSWVRYYDALHYVTGITQASPDELIASGSMSHFSANTLIRLHKPDATPTVEYPKLQWTYYQRIAYSGYDETLYGIVNSAIAAITDGVPAEIAALEGPLYTRERMAMGIAPGVSALIPIAKETLIMVPKDGIPWKLKNGELSRFALPPTMIR